MIGSGSGSKPAFLAATRVHRGLATRRAYPQAIEGEARDDRRQPATQVVDRRGIGPARAEPGVLHGVLGLDLRAEHAVRDAAQVGAMLLEALGEPVGVGHSVTFSSAVPSPS